MRYDPLSTADGPELHPMRGDADAVIHVPASASFYEAAIEGLTMLDEQILLEAPDFPRLYDSGVIYRKEARDTWRHADDVLCSGWGDCEDLAAWRAAELRASGEDPGAYVYVYQSGPHRFHAVVAHGDGRIEDPSLILGMQVSDERRKKMPKYVGQGEGRFQSNPRAFGTCPRALDVSGAGEDRLQAGAGRETIGDASSTMTAPAHKCSMACPHFAADWRRAVQSAIQGDDGSDDSSSSDPSQDPNYDPSQDPNYDPSQDAQQDQGGGGGPSKAQRVGRFFGSAANAVYQPFKYAAMPLVYGAKFGGQVLKTGADVARGVTKIATAPLKLASKIFSIFGEEDWQGLKAPQPALLGVEEDEDYEDGDEEVVTRADIFSSPHYEEADDDDFVEAAELAPPSQRLRFQTTEVAPGLWGGRLMIPRADEPGRAFSMYSSPARSEREALERMRNLALQAAENPGVQLAVSPAALITMAAMKAGENGKVASALRSIGKFVRIEG